MQHLCGKSVHRRAPHKQHKCIPSNHFVSCIKIKAHCVMGASFACHRERLTPHLGPPPHVKVPEWKSLLNNLQIHGSLRGNLSGSASGDKPIRGVPPPLRGQTEPPHRFSQISMIFADSHLCLENKASGEPQIFTQETVENHRLAFVLLSAVKQRGREKKGPPEIAPKSFSQIGPKWCSVLSIGVIGQCARKIGHFLRRNFWMISGGPFLSRPLLILDLSPYNVAPAFLNGNTIQVCDSDPPKVFAEPSHPEKLLRLFLEITSRGKKNSKIKVTSRG